MVLVDFGRNAALFCKYSRTHLVGITESLLRGFLYSSCVCFRDSVFVFVALRTAVRTTQVNPWQRLPVKEVIFDLIQSSKLDELRAACYSKGLLTQIQKSALRAKTDAFEHNDLLMDILEKGGGRTFDCFLSLLSKLDSLIFRDFFDRLVVARGS